MASVMYRLLSLEFPPGSLDAMIRLGILGFCSHIFLQWTNVKIPHHHLQKTYKDCLLSLEPTVSPQLHFWLLFSGDISLFTGADSVWLRPWLHTMAGLCGIRTWEEARAVLKRFLWVDFVHDQVGVEIFDAILKDWDP